MDFDRRCFLKLAGAAGATALAGRAAVAQAATVTARSQPAVLVDSTRCVGCRGCEAACAETNHLPGPASLGDDKVFDVRRRTDVDAFTVVNRSLGTSATDVRYYKTQCMHCLDPGCASACPAKALEKTAEGPVVYNPERCLGCRYCMVACPFDVPKFEYEKAAPYVRKCHFCANRQKQGLMPACVTVCPSGALQFGQRATLIEEANHRIYTAPDSYEHRIFGETEVGGTSWLYIGDRKPEALGFRTDLGSTSAPERTRTALAAVPFVLTLWPPLLMGLYTFSKRRAGQAPADSGAQEPNHD